MGLNRFPMNDYSGGLSIWKDPVDLETNETPECLNVTLGPEGSLQMRPVISYGTHRNLTTIENCFEWVDLGVPIDEVIWSSNGVVVDVNGAILFTGSASSIWDFESMPDRTGVPYLWMVNGVNPPQKWNGRSATAVPVPAGFTITDHRAIKAWKNRLFLLNTSVGPKNRIHFSPVGDPEGAYGFVDIGTANEAVVDFEVFGDQLIVFKRHSVWAIYDPVSMTNRRLGEPGVAARFQTAVVENRLYYHAPYKGIYSLSLTGQITEETAQISSIFTGHRTQGDRTPALDFGGEYEIDRVRLCPNPVLPRLIFSIPKAWGASGWTRGRFYELLPGSTTERDGRVTRRRSAIFRHALVTDTGSYAPTAMCVNHSGVSPGEVSGGFNNGVVAQSYSLFDASDFSTGTRYADLISPGVSRPIPQLWKSSVKSIQEMEPLERLRRVNILHSGPIRLTVVRDRDVSGLAFTLASNLPGGQVGTPQFNRVRPETRSRFTQLVLQDIDGLGFPWRVVNMELVYRGGKEHDD